MVQIKDYMISSILNNFVRTIPIGGEATTVQFFKPNITFLQTMKPFFYNTIIDVGSGLGTVPSLLRLYGYKVIGIDIRNDNTLFSVVLANGASFSYPFNSVGLFCRPCHGPFVVACIEQMIGCDVKAIGYIGFPKNSKSDLGVFRKHFRKIAINVGEDKEAFYIWERQ